MIRAPGALSRFPANGGPLGPPFVFAPLAFRVATVAHQVTVTCNVTARGAA